MKWFKHDADASSDAKIRKLIIRHGAVGYAVYFHCLELIAGNVSNENITFELEHDSEIIADNLRIKGTTDKSGIEIVEEIMKYIIELNLFENTGGKITCMKMVKRLDLSMTSNSSFRKLIKDAKDTLEIDENHDFKEENHDESDNNHDTVMILGAKVMQEHNRTEENIIEKNNKYSFVGFTNQQVLDFFNETCIDLPKATKVNDKRQKSLAAIRKEFTDEQIKQAFVMVNESDYLSGRGERSWKNCSFDWLMIKNNMLKVLEGNYSRGKKSFVSDDLKAKGVHHIENGKYYTERGTEFDPLKADSGCPF